MILDNFPKVLWINLDRSNDRRQYMENLLEEYDLTGVRIQAIDGQNKQELDDYCRKTDEMSDLENACSCSHIKAIVHFYDNMVDDYVLIVEDDVSFEFLKYIPYDWSEFYDNLPKNFSTVQLAISRMGGRLVTDSLVKIHSNSRYFCAGAYLLSRWGAKEILDKYYPDRSIKLDLYRKSRVVADLMILNVDDVYSFPIFTYKTSESTIHPEDLPLQNRSKNQQLIMWQSRYENRSNFDKEKFFEHFKNPQLAN